MTEMTNTKLNENYVEALEAYDISKRNFFFRIAGIIAPQKLANNTFSDVTVDIKTHQWIQSAPYLYNEQIFKVLLFTSLESNI